jgi:hypothetical protein
MSKGKLCAVCAWRETCQKKFRISKSPGATCVDFTRDLSIPRDEEEDHIMKQEQGQGGVRGSK